MPKGPWRLRCLDQHSPLCRTDPLACHPESTQGPGSSRQPASTPVMRRDTHEYGTENVTAGMADLSDMLVRDHVQCRWRRSVPREPAKVRSHPRRYRQTGAGPTPAPHEAGAERASAPTRLTLRRRQPLDPAPSNKVRRHGDRRRLCRTSIRRNGSGATASVVFGLGRSIGGGFEFRCRCDRVDALRAGGPRAQ